MDIKIDGKTISLKDKLSVREFRKLGRMPKQEDFEDPTKMLEDDWIFNLLDAAGWKTLNDEPLEDLIMVIQQPDFVKWLTTFFIDPKKVMAVQSK